jgi:hypothetical protein
MVVAKFPWYLVDRIYIIGSQSRKCIKLDDFVDMVRSRAHYYAKKFNMDYVDLEAEGVIIYFHALKDYNPLKASFSTFLYQRLSGYLQHYCIKEATEKMFSIDDVPADSSIFVAREYGPSKDQLLSYAKSMLSPNAFIVLEWIVNDRLEELRSKKNPALNTISAKLSIDLFTLKLAWQELADFWDWRGAAFYAEN